MNDRTALNAADEAFNTQNFDVRTLEDEINADQLCTLFLKSFYRYLVAEKEMTSVTAGQLARGADYFLREFVIGDRRTNIFSIDADDVRRFAGNWYIVKTLDPSIKELDNILTGVKTFYMFCRKLGKISSSLAEDIVQHCNQLDYYQARIDSFWKIEEDGFFAWNKSCPLKK